MRVLNFAEMAEESEKFDEKMDKVFRFDGQWLIVNVEYEYPIELSRIKSKTSLLRWAHHLCEKVWMDSTLIGEFIERVCKYKGWNLYEDGL